MSKRKVFLVTSNDPWEIVALGFAGENLARTVEWDIGPWMETYGEGEVQLLAKRPVDKNPYPVVVTRDGDSVLWTVRKEDLWYGNELGQAQLFYLMDGQVVARSKAFRTMTREAIEGDVQECSEPERDWVEQVLQSVASAEESAGAAGEASKAAEESARQAIEAEERLQQTIEETAVAAAENAANAAVERATQVAGTAADSAVESAEDAAGSAGVAGEKAEEAGKSAEAAAMSAEAAGLVEEKAGTYAGQAEESAADAKEQADAAEKSAELANQSAGRAEEAAVQAAESAEAAAGDAADARESADDAADSALSAAESAEMAQAYSGKPPVITDDIWYVWDAETDAYLSTGKPSRGEQGLTGPQGAAGPKGDTGEAAGFGVPVATVDNNVGVPEVTVSASGPDTAKVFSFAFSGIKGETGAQGPQGAKGEPGAGVGSVVRTAGNGAAGTTDTYTMYNDEGEEIGKFKVSHGTKGEEHDVETKTMDGFLPIKDSQSSLIKEFRIYGKSVQKGKLAETDQAEDPIPIEEVPINSTGEDGSITATVCGVNLLDFSGAANNKTSGGITATLTGDGGYVMEGTADSTAINIWFFGNYGGGINVFTLYPGTYTCKNVVLFCGQNSFATVANILPNVPYTFTVSQKVIVTGIRCVSAVVGKTYNETLYPILVCDRHILPWEAYCGQACTFNLSSKLYGIPVSANGNYTDDSGQQWVSNYIDVKRKKLVTRVNKVNISEFAENNVMTGTTGSRFKACPSLKPLKRAKMLSNYFGYRDAQSYGAEGNYITNDEDNYLFVRVTENLSLEEFQQKYSNLSILYQLETPIEYDLSDIPDFLAYSTNTNIMVESEPDAGILIQYEINNKSYIDQKAAALQEQIDILIGAKT